MFASTFAKCYLLFGLCTGAITVAMEYICFMGKCKQSRMYHLFFKVQIIVIISVCLYVCLCVVFGVCTGAIGIAMEHVFIMGKWMQSRRNYFCFESSYHCNHNSLPLLLLIFPCCLMTGAIGTAIGVHVLFMAKCMLTRRTTCF